MKCPTALILAASALSLGACNGLYGNDELARYVQRSDQITLSAGDAKEVNAATHTIDPWPRGVGDPRIPANGERMVHAVERYRRGPANTAAANPAPGAAAAPGAAVGAGAPPAAPAVAPAAGPGSQ